MTSHRYSRFLQIVLIVLLAGILTLVSCYPPGPYRTFTLKKGIGHFSFEYPSRYRVSKVEVRDDYRYTDMSIVGPWQEKEQDIAMIGITVTEPTEDEPDAEVTLEKMLSFISGWPDFELLDRSSVIVSGIQGEQYIFFYTRYRELQYGHEEEPVPTIMREVYFDYGGLHWTIYIVQCSHSGGG